jgi:hypothetical protein
LAENFYFTKEREKKRKKKRTKLSGGASPSKTPNLTRCDAAKGSLAITTELHRCKKKAAGPGDDDISTYITSRQG